MSDKRETEKTANGTIIPFLRQFEHFHKYGNDPPFVGKYGWDGKDNVAIIAYADHFTGQFFSCNLRPFHDFPAWDAISEEDDLMNKLDENIEHLDLDIPWGEHKGDGCYIGLYKTGNTEHLIPDDAMHLVAKYTQKHHPSQQWMMVNPFYRMQQERLLWGFLNNDGDYRNLETVTKGGFHSSCFSDNLKQKLDGINPNLVEMEIPTDKEFEDTYNYKLERIGKHVTIKLLRGLVRK